MKNNDPCPNCKEGNVKETIKSDKWQFYGYCPKCLNIFLVPIVALEYIKIDFTVMQNGETVMSDNKEKEKG